MSFSSNGKLWRLRITVCKQAQAANTCERLPLELVCCYRFGVLLSVPIVCRLFTNIDLFVFNFYSYQLTVYKIYRIVWIFDFDVSNIKSLIYIIFNFCLTF